MKQTVRIGNMWLSPVGLGCWSHGGQVWGPQDDRNSIDAILTASDSGINWLDTAPAYGAGHSESVIGKALAARSRAERPYVFTKFGVGLHDVYRSATCAEVIAECEGSLRRLRLERIDLYQLHWPVPQPVEETAEACETLLRAGKIRGVGICNPTVEQLEAWEATGVPISAAQSHVNLFVRSGGGSVAWCERRSVPVLAYSAMYRGLLFGTWDADKRFRPDDHRSQRPDFVGPRFHCLLAAVDRIRSLGESDGFTCAEACLASVLKLPGIRGAIVGARSARQVQFLANSRLLVPPELQSRIEQVVMQLCLDLRTCEEELAPDGSIPMRR
ncbi:MAG: aldo/keto reductase [Bryobacteraceae bacterium]|nr:aldo/keto reductase [Bryobacteraceae bacterium]